MTDAQVVIAALGLALTLLFGINQWKRRTRQRDLIRVEYLVVRSIERLPRLVAGDVESIPLGGREGRIRLHGPGFELWSDLAAAGLGRRGTPWDEVVIGAGDHIADYLAEHPDIPAPSYGSYDGYLTSRTLSKADLRTPEVADHPVVQFLLARGVPVSELGHIVTFPEPHCEAVGYSLRFLPREIWLVMLVVEPLGTQSVTIGSVMGRVDGAGDSGKGYDVEVRLPPTRVTEDESVLLPLGAILPPFGAQVEESNQLWGDIVEPGLFQSVDRVCVPADRDDFSTIGRLIIPTKVEYRVGRRRRMFRPHSFDPSRLLALDTMWHRGTCPHLFERDPSGTLIHIRELLPEGHFALAHDSHVPSAGCREIVIAELEFEVTHLAVVEQAGTVLAADVTLHRGDALTIPVRDGVPVRLMGGYSEEFESTNPGGSRFKVAMIRRFLSMDTAANEWPG